MTRALIIDDEKGAAALLRAKMEKNFINEFDIDIACSAQEGILRIRQFKPDLVFLDIEMPTMNGFDVLKAISQIDFRIIFITAYDQYAIRAFRYYALDYLLKPVDTAELVEAVSRFRTQGSRDKLVQREQLINLLDRKI